MGLVARIPVTVPAAGAFEPVRIRGSVVYVEQSDVNTPAGVPTWHLQQGGDGFPCYSRVSFAWRPGFRQFYIRGTAAAAGTTLYLLIFDDPCGAGIYGSGAVFQPNPCGDAPEPVNPTGDPDHVLVVSGNAITVYDSTGNAVRDVVAAGTYTDIGEIHLDYASGRIYFVGVNTAATTAQLRRVAFDGTGDTLVWDTGRVTTTEWNVTWDEGLGAFLITGPNRVFTVNKDGSGPATISTAGITFRGGIGQENAAHLYTCQGTFFIRRDYATFTAQSSLNINSVSAEYDPLTGKVWHMRGGQIERYDSDLTGLEVIQAISAYTGDPNVFIYGRWIYWPDNSRLWRASLDDITTIESFFGGAPTSGSQYPWWE